MFWTPQFLILHIEIHSNTKFQARGDLIGYHSDRGRYGRLRKGFYGNSPRKLVMLTPLVI
jgi:hypothetical protein